MENPYQRPQSYVLNPRKGDELLQCANSLGRQGRGVAWVAAAVLSALLAADAQATSCIATGSQRAQIKASFEASSDVFSAHVEAFHPGAYGRRETGTLARLRVLKVWKGSLAPGDIATSSADDDVGFISGGYVPLLGSTVLIYGNGPQPFVLGSCSRNAPLEQADRDVRLLDRLAKPK